MPTVPEGVEKFIADGILYGPGKAANAGGVAVSGLEMSQNAERAHVDRASRSTRGCAHIMHAIHEQCRITASHYDAPGNYVHGANIAGFLKVADAMLDQGVV